MARMAEINWAAHRLIEDDAEGPPGTAVPLSLCLPRERMNWILRSLWAHAVTFKPVDAQQVGRLPTLALRHARDLSSLVLPAWAGKGWHR